MTLEEIRDLIKLVSKSGIRKVEIEREGFKLIIKGGAITQNEQAIYVQQAPTQQVLTAPAQVSNFADASVSVNTEEATMETNYITIKSPMIGTFYRTGGLDKPAFVEVGSDIQKGDKLCIIEAMKTFNEIEAEISGKIVKVLVDNASPVDYDQPLFLVDPS